MLRDLSTRSLLAAEKVKVRNVVHAAHRAIRSARLLGEIRAPDNHARVLIEGLSGIAALLGAIMHQAILADVHIACPGAATPLIRKSLSNRLLKEIQAREVPIFHRLHLMVDFTLALSQRT